MSIEWVEKREPGDPQPRRDDCMACDCGAIPFLLDGVPTHLAATATPEAHSGPTMEIYVPCPVMMRSALAISRISDEVRAVVRRG